MTAEQALRLIRLQTAVNQMAGRYGISCMEIATAQTGPERAIAHRSAARQYRALMRLTSTLTDHALGGTR
ncbi:hypothetical protein [Micromonospora arida]